MLTHEIKTDRLSPVSSATGPVGSQVLFDVKECETAREPISPVPG
jgi:hypothetical protein